MTAARCRCGAAWSEPCRDGPRWSLAERLLPAAPALLLIAAVGHRQYSATLVTKLGITEDVEEMASLDGRIATSEAEGDLCLFAYQCLMGVPQDVAWAAVLAGPGAPECW